MKKIPLLKIVFCHKCPKCGEGDIYEKLIEIRNKCDKCGNSLKIHDVGDGPVFFAMLISGIIITSLAFLVEMRFMTPLFLHVIIWFPTTICLAILLLKIIKSLVIGLEYRRKT